MTGVTADKIEVDSAYGKMTFKRTDIVAINFPENGASPLRCFSEKGAPAPNVNVEESLRAHNTSTRRQFALILPSGWKIDPNLATPGDACRA